MFSWILTHPWAYPALEVVHLLGLGLLLGSLVLLELRVWGLGGALPVLPLARLALGVTAVGFGLAVASGVVMLLSQWDELAGRGIFLAKMGLLLLAGLNALWFHRRHSLQRLDRLARAQTVFSLGLWALVVVCGRLIAYV